MAKFYCRCVWANRYGRRSCSAKREARSSNSASRPRGMLFGCPDAPDQAGSRMHIFGTCNGSVRRYIPASRRTASSGASRGIKVRWRNGVTEGRDKRWQGKRSNRRNVCVTNHPIARRPRASLFPPLGCVRRSTSRFGVRSQSTRTLGFSTGHYGVSQRDLSA